MSMTANCFEYTVVGFYNATKFKVLIEATFNLHKVENELIKINVNRYDFNDIMLIRYNPYRQKLTDVITALNKQEN